MTLVCLALGAAGCGIPTDHSAIPFNASPSASNCSGPISITIYLIRTTAGKTRLAPVSRPDIAKNGDAPLCAINELNLGPTSEESINGLQTAFDSIPEGLALLDTSGGEAIVELDPSFLSIASRTAVAEAFGQIVFTLTGLPGSSISKVKFVFNNGTFGGVVTGDLSIATSGVVSRSDYCSLAPIGVPCGAATGASSGTTRGTP